MATTTSTTSTSSIGSDIIASMGIGTFNPQTIAAALANAETIGTKSTLETSKTKATNKLTAYNTIQTALQSLKTGLTDLATASNFSQKAVTSSDSTSIGATMSSTPAVGSYEIAVTKKAKANTIATQAFTSQNTAIGSGTLKLSIAGSSQDITIDSGNNTLATIKDTINNANMGIAASVVNDGSGYRLLLTAKNSGAANTISMSVSGDTDGDDTDNAGLSSLISGTTTVSPAQDAEFSVNGLSLKSASNQVTGVIEGVTLNLNKENSSSTISVGSDTGTVKTAIKNVVDDYNAMKSILDNYTSYTTSKDDPTKGILAGDSTVSQLRYQMRSMLNFRVSDPNATVQSMADVGVKTELNGSLTLDETSLDKVLASSPDCVSKLFSSVGTPNSALIRFKNATDRTNEGTFDVAVNQVASKCFYLGGAVAATPNVGSTNNTFQISVNGTQSNVLSVNLAASATQTQIASYLQNLINNDANLKAKDARVSVSYNATDNRFEMLTVKYGSASKVALSNVGRDLNT